MDYRLSQLQKQKKSLEKQLDAALMRHMPSVIQSLNHQLTIVNKAIVNRIAALASMKSCRVGVSQYFAN